MTDSELGQALKTTALLEGEFTLRSGRKSNYYLDKYLFETQPTLLAELAKRYAKFVTSEIDRLAGPELGGIALATATALETGKPFVIVRNAKKADYGTGKLIEGRLEAGEQVLIIEDIATSGGQALEAAKVIEAAEASVAGIIVTIDREEGAREAIEAAGYPFGSLFTTSELGIKI